MGKNFPENLMVELPWEPELGLLTYLPATWLSKIMEEETKIVTCWGGKNSQQFTVFCKMVLNSELSFSEEGVSGFLLQNGFWKQKDMAVWL